MCNCKGAHAWYRTGRAKDGELISKGVDPGNASVLARYTYMYRYTCPLVQVRTCPLVQVQQIQNRWAPPAKVSLLPCRGGPCSTAALPRAPLPRIGPRASAPTWPALRPLSGPGGPVPGTVQSWWYNGTA